MSPLIFRVPDEAASMATGGTGEIALSAQAGVVQLPEGFDPAAADYVRAGPDLIMSDADGTEIVVTDYFTSESPPVILGEDGSRISGELATQLAGPVAPGQVAGEAAYSEAIGHVSTLSGQVTAVRVDGTRVTLQTGDSMYSGDVLETGMESGVGIVLADGTSLSMADEGRMVLDEMVYDPSTQEGSISLSVLEGVFTIVSGEVAKVDPDAMMVTTPVGTIGIRGTQVGIDLTGEDGMTVVLMEEADGFVGEVIVTNAMGVMSLNQAYGALTVQGYNAAPVAVTNYSRNDLTNTFGGTLEHLPTETSNANDYGQQDAMAVTGDGLADFDAVGGEAEFVTEAGPAENDFVTAAGEADAEAPAEDVVFGEEVAALDAVDITEAAVIEPVEVVAPPPPPPPEVVQEPVIETVVLPIVEEPAPNTPPTAEAGTVMTAEDDSFSGQLAAADADGDALTFAMAPEGEAAHGTVTINADGTFTYTPTQDFGGTDTFSYLVTDAAGATATATMTVTVTPVADVPQIASANVIGYEDAAVSLSIAANMPAGTSETIRSVTLSGVPQGATLSAGTDNGNGNWSLSADQLSGLKMIPPTDYNGTLNLTVAATSTDGGTVSNSFTAIIAPVADVPMLTLGDVIGAEDSSIMLNISAAMLPQTGETVETLTLTGVPEGATLSAGADNGNGSWTLQSSDLGGLILTPPQDYNGTFDMGVSVTSSDGGVTTGTFEVEVGAVPDVPVVAVHDAMGTEDGAISLVLAANMPVGTAETLNTITVSGVPEGATLSAGTDSGGGTWTLTPDQLSGLSLMPPPDYHGDFSLTMTATSSDGGTATNTLGVTVNPVPDTPQIALTNAVGAEDSDLLLTLAVGMSPDTTETVDTVTIGGVPVGASLSAGTNNGDGTWTLLASQISGLILTPPQDYKGSFDLSITAVSTDGSVATDSLAVNVTPVADVPVLSLNDASGAEDSAISLTVAATMLDDTNETITSVIVSGVPEGAVLSAGTDTGDGTWSLTVNDLQGLTLTPPQDYNGAFNLGVSVISSDGGVATDSLSVHVGAVADVPVLAVTDVAGSEDTAIALTIAAAMPSDTNEILASVILSGVPDGAILSTGTDNGDGSWTLNPDQLSGLTLTPPNDYSGSIGLTVNAISTDGGTATSTFTVGVAAVSDAPQIAVSDVSGAEDAVIALDIAANMAANTSETIDSITVSGVPTGAILSAGTDNGDGTWSLTADQLDGLTLTPPENFSGTIPLGISAVSTDGGTAVSGATVTVGPVADAPTLSVTLGEGVENTFNLFITAGLVDADGSETLSLTVAGIPDGATLSSGTDNGDGTWTLSPDQLSGLALQVPDTVTTDFSLSVMATSTESGGGAATVSEDVFVDVPNPPDVVVGDVNGLEDTAIALDIVAAGAESLTLLGIPDGATLSAGTDNGDGSWTLSPDQLDALNLTPPADYSGAINLSVVATAPDGSEDTDAFSIAVGGVADVPILNVEIGVGVSTGSMNALTIENLGGSAGFNNTIGYYTLDENGEPSVGQIIWANVKEHVGDTFTLDGVDQASFGMFLLSDGDRENDHLVNGQNLTFGQDSHGHWQAYDGNGDRLEADHRGGLFFTHEAFNTFGRDYEVDSAAPGNMNWEDLLGGGDNDFNDVNLNVEWSQGGAAIEYELNITAALADVDGSETLSLLLAGLPADAVLSAGTDNGDGTWTVSPADLSGLTLTVPGGVVDDFSLIVTATATEADGDQVSISDSVLVDLPNAPPSVSVEDVSGSEDNVIAFNLSATLADSVTISGVPEGAALSAGIDNGDGTWTLSGDQLDGLTLTPPLDFSGTIALGVTVTSVDGATAQASFSVEVAPVADTPILTVSNVGGGEDAALALVIAATMPGDTNETLESVTLSGLPAGASLSAGSNNGDGSWSVAAEDLSGLTLTPPLHYSGTLGLTVTAVSSDGGTSTQTLSATVAPVVDHPILTVTNVAFVDVGASVPGEEIDGTKRDDEIVGTSGADEIDGGKGDDIIYGDPLGDGGGEGQPTAEDYVVALDVNAALVDVDGSEALNVEISGLPDDALLSLGTDNGDGTWTIAGDDLESLESLSMTLPEGTPTENFSLDVKAIAVETASGDTATTESSIDIVFTSTAEGAGDVIRGGEGDDEIHGGAGNDLIRGGRDDDQLYGDAGDDVIKGGSGDDVLIGGAGDDVLVGGRGEDSFVFRAGDGHDFIMDLSEQDELRFEGPEFSAEDIDIQHNDDNTSTITFGREPGDSVTVNNADIQAGEGYTVTQDGDAVVVSFDENSCG